MAFCSRCGEKTDPEARFCEACGAEISSAPMAAAPATSTRKSAGPRFGLAIAGLGIIALIGIGVAVVPRGGGKTPSGRAEAFFRAVDSGDADRAVLLLSSEARGLLGMLGDGKMRAAFAEMGRKSQSRGGIDRIEVLSETVNGDRAKVSFRVSFNNGESELQNADMIREDGEWKLALNK